MLPVNRPVTFNIAETCTRQGQVGPEQPVFLGSGMRVEPVLLRQHRAAEHTGMNGNHKATLPTVEEILLANFKTGNRLLSLGEHPTLFITQKVVAN